LVAGDESRARVNDVLVVGAGPTGLTMAAQLHAHGVRLRIVERRHERRDPRAFVVHPRTLELVAHLGLAEALIGRGDPNVGVRLHAGGRSVDVGLVSPGHTDTAYPYLLFIPQDAVEEVLEEHLRRVGVVVERGVELTGLAQRPDAVDVELRRDDGSIERDEAGYVLGCDGADSTVRRSAGFAFRARSYRPSLLLADLDIDGELESDRLHGFVSGPGLLFLFPSPVADAWRLLAVRPDHGGLTDARAGADVEDLAVLQDLADHFAGGSLRLQQPVWSTQVRLRRGQATRYRRGRVLLAGDAAHLHSPAGAQGMNTGIQDACNLGWKLALVVSGKAPEALLDSYQAERWPVARRTRQLTDLAFLLEAADHAPLHWLRQHATPLVLPIARGRSIPRGAFRLLGGLLTRYRGSPIVEPGRPRLRRGPRPGDRLPDGRIVHDGEPGWLHELLREPAHHLLLCGRQDGFDRTSVDDFGHDASIPVRILRLGPVPGGGVLVDPDGGLLRRLGVRDTAVYLVRPDGYIAYRAEGSGLAGAGRHLRNLEQQGISCASGRGRSRSSPSPGGARAPRSR
jgi:2-polyprenyl-6-methoxyphenol hydroxylase-like FAD-dependent oxidoreductase